MITTYRPMIVYSLFFALGMTSCGKQSSKEYTYEKDGVSFTCPANWKITDEEKLDETTYYLNCERRGFDESAIVSFTWFNEEYDAEELLNLYQSEMEENTIYKHSSLAFGPTEPGSFGKYETLSRQYTCSILGVDHRGEFHTFYTCDKTFYIMIQEANEDEEKNAPGFELVESSFSCK